MLQNVTATPSRRSLEFGIYRDGDNNLDAIQEATLSQALRTSARDGRIEFTVEDTTRTHAAQPARDESGGGLRTYRYSIADGDVIGARAGKAHDMSDEANLARFVARTLDNAQMSGARQTWIDLVDHGGGDGGGLETRDGSCMSMPDIAEAIADGVALHAREHPEDAGRGVDGVVANQCLMDTMGFADALSSAGVRYLAASPETMLAPGVPSNVAHAIAAHENDPLAMAKAVVGDVMRTTYDAGDFGGFKPAAAFDVLDLDPAKFASRSHRSNASTTTSPRARKFPKYAVRCAKMLARSTGWYDRRSAAEVCPGTPIVPRLPSTTRSQAMAGWIRFSAAMRARRAMRSAISFSRIARAAISNRSAMPITPTRQDRPSIYRPRTGRSIRGRPPASAKRTTTSTARLTKVK